MVAYLKRNLRRLHLIFFKPVTFGKRYYDPIDLEFLAQQLFFILFIAIIITVLTGGLLKFLGLKFDWFEAIKGSLMGIFLGILIGLRANLASGVVGGIAGGVTVGLLVGSADAAKQVTGGMLGGIVISMPVGLTLGMAVGLAESGIGYLIMIVSFGATFGLEYGATYGVAVGLAVSLTFSVAASMAFFRFPYLLIYTFHYFKCLRQPTWPQFKKLPIFYDEIIRFSLPRLHRLLVTLVKADRTTGMKAIDFIIQERPYQLSQARRALFEITIQDLSTLQDFRQIANTPQLIGFLEALPGKAKPKRFEEGEPFLQEISALVTQYLSFTTIYSRRKQIEIIAAKIKDFQHAAAYLQNYVGRGFVKVAYVWGELVTAEEAALQRQIATEPIPNPFVVGNPLRREDKEAFQGREDIARMLESEIMRDKSLSPMLLYGKRRIGKTSTLLNLRKLLGPKIIPVYLDGQDAALTQSDASFLYQTQAKILQEVPREWTTADSLILLNRQEFEARAFELSGKLLEQLRERLQADNARVLLCLDEYERLDRAYEQGRITDDLLDQLRHYLQHETRLAFLFAGAHRMTERRAIRWSDYLINVKTIKLGFLDHASAEKLITAPIPDWPLKYEPGVVEQILQITHRQPYLLQAVASDLVDYLNTQQRTRATMADLEETIKRVLVTAELYFQNTWEEDLTEPERALILVYLRANEKVDPVANKEVLHGLVQNDIFEVVDNLHVFVIDLFKRWVLKNLPV